MTALVSHANPVTQKGVTIISNALMLRKDVSLGAKAVYGYLSHLAWRNDVEAVDPPLEKVAEDLGITETMVTKYTRELASKPTAIDDPDGEKLLEVKRRGQGRPNVYQLRDPRISQIEILESGDGVLPTRARSLPAKKKSLEEESNDSSLGGLPEMPRVFITNEGKNEPLDALAEVCHVTPKSKRMVQVALALNGAKGKSQDGIRALYWGELCDWADETGNHAKLREMQAHPEIFADRLAKSIRRRGAVQQERMPVAFGPQKFRDWFLDIDGMPDPGKKRAPSILDTPNTFPGWGDA